MSAIVSPLEAEVWLASDEERQRPPSRSMADSNERRVRVLASKKSVARRKSLASWLLRECGRARPGSPCRPGNGRPTGKWPPSPRCGQIVDAYDTAGHIVGCGRFGAAPILSSSRQRRHLPACGGFKIGVILAAAIPAARTCGRWPPKAILCNMSRPVRILLATRDQERRRAWSEALKTTRCQDCRR